MLWLSIIVVFLFAWQFVLIYIIRKHSDQIDASTQRINFLVEENQYFHKILLWKNDVVEIFKKQNNSIEKLIDYTAVCENNFNFFNTEIKRIRYTIEKIKKDI